MEIFPILGQECRFDDQTLAYGALMKEALEEGAKAGAAYREAFATHGAAAGAIVAYEEDVMGAVLPLAEQLHSRLEGQGIGLSLEEFTEQYCKPRATYQGIFARVKADYDMFSLPPQAPGAPPPAPPADNAPQSGGAPQ